MKGGVEVEKYNIYVDLTICDTNTYSHEKIKGIVEFSIFMENWDDTNTKCMLDKIIHELATQKEKLVKVIQIHLKGGGN